MFKTFVIVCILACGPAPVESELFSTKQECMQRAEEMAKEIAQVFLKYGVKFTTGHVCKKIVST